MASTTNPKWPPFIAAHLPEILRLKRDPARPLGWSAKLRQRFGYCSPDEIYEATVAACVRPDTTWLDVGCGRNVFPANPAAAAMLAARCRLLVGLDPSDNIAANPLPHERVRCAVQDFRTDRRFDLVTMRMVAEHIEFPEPAVDTLARLLRPGGSLVLYTVHKWTPAVLVGMVTPPFVHRAVKRLLWRSDRRDTFPVYYRMNTHRALQRLLRPHGFIEDVFLSLDDARTFARWKASAALELRLWRWLNQRGLPYPDTCILAIYRKA